MNVRWPLIWRRANVGGNIGLPKAEPPLTEEEIRNALCIHSPGVVKEIYDTAIRQVQNEHGRQGRLDAKATSLLTAIGLSLSVAFVFGGQILTNATLKWNSLASSHRLVVVLIFWATVVCGLASSVFAIYALRVGRNYRMLNERNIFDPAVLSDIDQKDSDDESVTVYRRHMIPQLWVIAQTHARVHERKAVLVARGQTVFGAFLFGIVLIAALMARMLAAQAV